MSNGTIRDLHCFGPCGDYEKRRKDEGKESMACNKLPRRSGSKTLSGNFLVFFINFMLWFHAVAYAKLASHQLLACVIHAASYHISYYVRDQLNIL